MVRPEIPKIGIGGGVHHPCVARSPPGFGPPFQGPPRGAVMQLQTDAGEGTRKKPDGGDGQVSTLTIGGLWWCYSQGLISLRAVRVGLALFELRIRRSAYLWTEKKHGRPIPEVTPDYTTKEIADYCGLPEKRAKATLQELITLGLVVEFAPTCILFARSPAELALTPDELAAFQSWMSGLTKRKRVPLGRRILALLCESPSPALIAVILGVSIRCS